jgi:O-antigen biosynthesis protein
MPFDIINYPIALSVPHRQTGHNAWIGHIPFAFILLEMIRPQAIVELGTYQGSSYCALCQAVEQLKLPCRCFGIDTWRGDEHTGAYGDEILNDLRAHHDPRYAGFSTLVRSTFDGAVKRFADSTIDLLHIDGLHTYEAVKHDYETWRPKLSGRAVVLFHDTAERKKDFGVWRLWEELRGQYPSFAFLHYHGLGVLAVGQEQPEELLDFLRVANQLPIAISRLFDALGERLDALRVSHHLCSFLDQGQAFAVKWLSEIGTPPPDEPVNAQGNPFAAAKKMARDLETLRKADPRRG